MENLHFSEQLKKLRKAEAPPFLLTRINAKIEAAQAQQLPLSWGWGGALALGLLLLANLVVMKANLRPPVVPNSVEALADEMNLENSNQLYHE